MIHVITDTYLFDLPVFCWLSCKAHINYHENDDDVSHARGAYVDECYLFYGIVDQKYKSVIMTDGDVEIPCQLYLEGQERVWRFSDSPFPLGSVSANFKVKRIEKANNVFEEDPTSFEYFLSLEKDAKYKTSDYWNKHNCFSVHNTENKLIGIVVCDLGEFQYIHLNKKRNFSQFYKSENWLQKIAPKIDPLDRNYHPINQSDLFT